MQINAIGYKKILGTIIVCTHSAYAATPQPATAVATPTAQVAQPATAPASATPAVGTSPAVPTYKAEIEHVNAEFQKIATSKNRIKELLISIDNDINTAKMQVREARKKSFDMLKQDTADKATVIDAEVQQKLTVVTDLRKKLLEATTKAFDVEHGNIEQAIKQITTVIDQLKAKGVAFQATQAQALEKATVVTPEKPTQLPKSWAIASTETVTAEQEPTMIHYLLHRIADILSKIARFFYIFYNSCKEALYGAPATPSTPASVKPGAMPAAQATQTSSTPSKFSFAVHEAGISELEETRSNLVKSTYALEHHIIRLGQTLASNKAIGGAIQTDLMFFAPVEPTPAWRQTAEQCFSSCLDGASWVYRHAAQATTHIYHGYVEPIFNKVHHDINQETASKKTHLSKQHDPAQYIPAQKG